MEYQHSKGIHDGSYVRLVKWEGQAGQKKAFAAKTDPQPSCAEISHPIKVDFRRKINGEVETQETKVVDPLYGFVCEDEIGVYAWHFPSGDQQLLCFRCIKIYHP